MVTSLSAVGNEHCVTNFGLLSNGYPSVTVVPTAPHRWCPAASYGMDLPDENEVPGGSGSTAGRRVVHPGPAGAPCHRAADGQLRARELALPAGGGRPGERSAEGRGRRRGAGARGGRLHRAADQPQRGHRADHRDLGRGTAAGRALADAAGGVGPAARAADGPRRTGAHGRRTAAVARLRRRGRRGGPGRRGPADVGAHRWVRPPQALTNDTPTNDSAPAREPDGGAVLIRRSERRDVRSLRALLALLDVERDPLAFIERAVPAGLDGRVVDEDVRSATVGGGEAEPLLSVEPLHCSFGHCSLLAVVVHRGPAIAQGLPDGVTLAGDCPIGTPGGAS